MAAIRFKASKPKDKFCVLAEEGSVELFLPDGTQIPGNCIRSIAIAANGGEPVTATVEFFVVTEETE